MSINNWDLWHAARKKKVDTQTLRLLEKTTIVKSGAISAKRLLQDLESAGITVSPVIATEYEWEWNYRDLQKQSRNVALVFWVFALVAAAALIVMLTL